MNRFIVILTVFVTLYPLLLSFNFCQAKCYYCFKNYEFCIILFAIPCHMIVFYFSNIRCKRIESKIANLKDDVQMNANKFVL